MAIGLTFIQNAVENALATGAAGALTVLTSGAVHLIGDVPWYAVLSAGGMAALVSVLASLSSLRLGPDNGTASFLPQVVARPRDSTGSE